MSRETQHDVRRPVSGPSVGRLVEGAFAACLGLALLAMPALLLWILSPYPDSGAQGALRVAAALWLLAHGADLVRPDTLGGGAAPLGVTPMLLTALPVFLLYRVVRLTGATDRRSVALVAAGYLTVGTAAAWFTLDGPLPVEPLSAALYVPGLTLATLTFAGWAVRGRPAPRLPSRLGGERPNGPRAGAAVRTAAVGTVVLCGGGAVLAAAALLARGGAAQDAFPRLASSWSGEIAVLLLCVALAPNVAVWAAAYGLGPGFSLGAGSVVGPLLTTPHPVLPSLPLLAAVPGEGPGGPLAWTAAGAVPLAAGWAAGWCTGRAGVPVPGTRHGAATGPATVATAALGALGCGLAVAALAAFSGGPLGTGALAAVGPVWWWTGGAALGWTALASVPTALLVRWWRLRDPHPLLAAVLVWRRFTAWCATLRPAPEEPAGAWHETGSRHSRWAALKEVSGGLMPDFDPVWRSGPPAGPPAEPPVPDPPRAKVSLRPAPGPGRHRRP
ncbi:cell division protein PerM [Streptomyces sp. GSL17-111]|uniref:cell division protein PerM n=1 Tax=Streptomyces sp. GSL17-111 TaxID=3121596 RepID=UPI0030F4704B